LNTDQQPLRGVCADAGGSPELRPAHVPSERAGVVVIARNEGERLQRCLTSLGALRERTVYVDSGSSDGSVAYGRSVGVSVEELDCTLPFTAARARNAGLRKLIETRPSLEYVFFVDGDCEVAGGWIDAAIRFLDAHPDAAVVFGRRRERFPQRSVYNLLCDMEWQNIPVGEAGQCGGDAVMRASALAQVGGYRPDLICGEEPELCLRLRRQGWHIWRIDAEMTIHDAAMTNFGQWARRTKRGGFAFAQGAYLHGASKERHWVTEARRIWMWGIVIPLVILGLAIALSAWALLLFAIYPLQILRLALRGTRPPRENWVRAVALVVGKFPEAAGLLKFRLDRLRGSHSQLIEYK
jgi:GT2 family glycosyltransferase